MNKSINLTGLSTNPSDYSCDDGNLSTALNVFHDLGAISPISPTSPMLLASLGGNTVLYRHENSNYKHLIVKTSDDEYYWCDESNITTDSTESDKFFSEMEGKDASVIGINNILEFVCDDAVYYYLWKNDSEYKYIGDKIPELDISFGLRSHGYATIMSGDTSDLSGTYFSKLTKFTLSSGTASWSNMPRKFTGDDITRATDATFSEVNKFYGWCKDNGYFYQPFLLRYAYRMFDGSLTMHSVPIFMRVCENQNPIVHLQRLQDNNTFYLEAIGNGMSLHYKYKKDDDIDNWKDLVKSVEIFVSSPLYTYNTNGKCDTIYSPSDSYVSKNFYDEVVGQTCQYSYDGEEEGLFSPMQGICNEDFYKGDGAFHQWGENTSVSGSNNDVKCYPVFYPNKQYGLNYAISLPKLSDDEYIDRVENNGTFFHIKSIPIEELVESTDDYGTDITLGEGVLNSLEAMEVMTDDYGSHSQTTPSSVVCYNNRANKIGIKEKLGKFFPPHTTFQMCRSVDYTPIHVLIYCRNSKESIIKPTITDEDARQFLSGYFFYPDTSAYKMVFFTSNTEYEGSTSRVAYYKKEVILKQSTTLNGSVKFYALHPNKVHVWEYSNIGYEEITAEEYNALLAIEESIQQNVTNNVVYTSEVDNPFVTLAKNVEQVGNGKIIALVPQATALSQGQFGEFPMMAFTTDGIWALSVSETGGWSAKQPFSRDVVLNEDPGNILQLDKSVMFASSRGLMLVSGSNVDCISEVFDGLDDDFEVHINDGISVTGKNFAFGNLIPLTDILEYRTEASIDKLNCNFKDFIGDAVFLYDYANQRIIIGNPNKSFSYVYNMRDKLWTTICQCITSSVNSYPNCYAMTKSADSIVGKCDVAQSTVYTPNTLPSLYNFGVVDKNSAYYYAVVKTTEIATKTAFEALYGQVKVSTDNGATWSYYEYGSRKLLTSGKSYLFKYGDGKGHWRKLRITYSKTSQSVLDTYNSDSRSTSGYAPDPYYSPCGVELHVSYKNAEQASSNSYKLSLDTYNKNGVSIMQDPVYHPEFNGRICYSTTNSDADCQPPITNRVEIPSFWNFNIDASMGKVYVFYYKPEDTDSGMQWSQNFISLEVKTVYTHNVSSNSYGQVEVDAPTIEIVSNNNGVTAKAYVEGMTANEFAQTNNGIFISNNIAGVNTDAQTVPYNTEFAISPSTTKYFGFIKKDETRLSEIKRVEVSAVKEVNENKLLVDFSRIGDEPGDVFLPSEGYILTRPIKLDEPDSMKTISKIIVRGKFDAQHVSIALFGSRNLYDWVVVGSASGNKLTLHHGTPYKYFRVALITKLMKSESINSLDIEYDVKFDNKIR